MREGYVGQPRVSQIVGPNDGDKVPPYAELEALRVGWSRDVVEHPDVGFPVS